MCECLHSCTDVLLREAEHQAGRACLLSGFLSRSVTDPSQPKGVKDVFSLGFCGDSCAGDTFVCVDIKINNTQLV